MVEQRAASVASRLGNHWDWRPEWTPDRPCLMWYLIFENQPDLASHAELLQSRLAHTDALDVVPVPWLHLTLDQVGYVDAVPPQQVDEVVDSVRRALQGWSPDPVTVGPVATMRSAVVLDASGVDDLHERLKAGTTAALQRDTDNTIRVFRGHVSLAYANRSLDAHLAVEPLGTEAEQRVAVGTPRLALAAVTRKDRHYQWTVREQLPL